MSISLAIPACQYIILVFNIFCWTRLDPLHVAETVCLRHLIICTPQLFDVLCKLRPRSKQDQNRKTRPRPRTRDHEIRVWESLNIRIGNGGIRKQNPHVQVQNKISRLPRTRVWDQDQDHDFDTTSLWRPVFWQTVAIIINYYPLSHLTPRGLRLLDFIPLTGFTYKYHAALKRFV